MFRYQNHHQGAIYSLLKLHYKKSHQFRCASWVLWQHAVLCDVMLRRVSCYGCAFCASLCEYHATKRRIHIRSRALFAT